MILGVDYAATDGNMPPQWSELSSACAAAGSVLGFAIFRGAWGTVPDPTVGRDRLRAKSIGLTTGAYLYLRMKLSPVDQVHAFADNVGPLTERDLPPILDIEDTGVSAEDELRAITEAWEEVVKVYGTEPVNYTSSRVWTDDLHNLDPGKMRSSPLWLAKPWPFQPRSQARLFLDGRSWLPVVPRPWGDLKNWWIHQYQGDAYPCPGFTSTVDLSRFNVLRNGEEGDRVRWTQRRLKTTPVDGVFGQETFRAVVTFQAEHGLVADGVVGPKTFAALAWQRV